MNQLFLVKGITLIGFSINLAVLLFNTTSQDSEQKEN